MHPATSLHYISAPSYKFRITGGSCHKYHFYRNKCFVATNTCLLRQTFVIAASPVCHTCLLLLRQTRVRRDKHVFCRDKSMLVATKRLPPQTRVCREQIFVATNILSGQKYFDSTNIILSLQKWYLLQLPPVILSSLPSYKFTLHLCTQLQVYTTFMHPATSFEPTRRALTGTTRTRACRWRTVPSAL